jgi:leucyl aminopeptidase
MKIIITSPKEAAGKKNIFIPLFQKESPEKDEIFLHLPEESRRLVKQFVTQEFKGETDEIKSLWLQGKLNEHIVFFGLGEKKKWNERMSHLLPRRMIRYAKTNKIQEFATKFNPETMYRFAVNALMADFDFNIYKERPPNGWPEVKTIYLAADEKYRPEIQKEIREEMIIGEEVNACRALANTPGGDMTPAKLAKEAVKAGKKAGFGVRVFEEKDMKKLGMGGILGVAKGSAEKPKFIIMEYHGAERTKAEGKKSERPLVLVGKGVTFDTGGLNLKPEPHIYEMHMDMSGGAAVIHGITAIARLKLPLYVVGIVPAVENMPSGSSYRPGDILKTMSGKTIEVLNTDAEGRVILSDALYYGAKKYKPGLMADLATLTGAAHVALGNYCSAIFTNQEELTEKLVEIGKKSGDYVWPLPLWDEYLAEIKGTFGDIANIAKNDRWGGAIHGAKFLEQFVNSTPWAHIDIAPKMTTVEGDYLIKGASGAGVRYIVELAKQYPTLL